MLRPWISPVGARGVFRDRRYRVRMRSGRAGVPNLVAREVRGDSSREPEHDECERFAIAQPRALPENGAYAVSGLAALAYLAAIEFLSHPTCLLAEFISGERDTAV